MMRYSCAGSVTTSETVEPSRRGNICRLRLTLPVDDPSNSEHNDLKKDKMEKVEKTNSPTRRRRKNGILHPEKNGNDQPTLHLYTVPTGGPAARLPAHGMVYGVVHRSDRKQQNEVVVYEWSTHQLKEEMNYIKDVRVTLENIRERMFGEYDEMKQKIKELSREIQISTAQQETLQSHNQAQSAALDNFGEMNSSLTGVAIDLQKTLVEVTLKNCDIKDEITSLKHSYEESMEKLKERQKQLEAAQVENTTLKLKVESSQEANAEVMREMTRKLHRQYEEKLQEEERKHLAEKEALGAKTNQFLKAIEDANEKVRMAELRIGERDQRIEELDRLIICMEEEREQLQEQLLHHEDQLQRISTKPQSTFLDKDRTQHLEEAAGSLKERIKHLDDMVNCQQKKVKYMVEEVELLRRKIQQKDLLIQQLLERVAFLEGENKELQDKMDYLKETQSRAEVETRDIGISCDLSTSTSHDHSEEQTVYCALSREDGGEQPVSCIGSGIIDQAMETSGIMRKPYTPYMRILQLSAEKTEAT
ncbi:myocardial zonula adherens protein isoform X2 [Ambystoma mexicanum]|uniref:myocardial zonula adherens protein isoform X2 n=1 Tax=Ambystoma mexicanum TaxID=8296 RepID=UPI0037E88082